MKVVFRIALATIGALFLLVAVCISFGHVERAKTTPESYDLSADELVALERKAIQEGDQKSAARIYWYYRFTKSDFVNAQKWEYAVLRPGETNSGLPHDSVPSH